MNRRLNLRITAALLAVTMLATMVCACGKKDKETEATGEETTVTTTEVTTTETEPTQVFVPEIMQIQSICELAVMKTYYHNVAKGVIEAGTGLTHWGETDKEFWVYYSAYITYGIDFHDVTMEMDGNNIIVHMPHARILSGVEVVANSIGDPFYEENEWWQNDVQIHAEQINQAIAAANEQLLAEAEADSTTLRSAEFRVRQLIENYINQIMQLSGDEYTVTFEFIEEQAS